MSISPLYYSPGTFLSINVNGGNASVIDTIVKAFTPFTMSQVLIVRTASGTPTNIPSSSLVVLKIYDPRFVRDVYDIDRYSEASKHPWQSQHEMSTTSKCKRQGGWWRDCMPSNLPRREDAQGWNDWYDQRSMLQWRLECNAYARSFTPTRKRHPILLRFLYTLQELVEDRYINLCLLVIKHILDAISLKDIGPVDLDLAQSLTKFVQMINLAGVVHCDLIHSNILFTPKAKHSRCVIIDFGQAQTRGMESEEDWDTFMEFEGDYKWVANQLKKHMDRREHLSLLGES